MRKTLMSFTALLIVVACSKMSSPTEPRSTASGSLAVTVADLSSKSGISNVTVEIRESPTGPVVLTATTDSSGAVKFNLPAGSYWIHVVEPPGYKPAIAINSMVTTNATTILTITLSA